MGGQVTDSQLAAILGALAAGCGIIGAAIKWAVGRMTISHDKSADALIANTASNAVLVVKLDATVAAIDRIAHYVDEHTPVNQPYPPQPPIRRQTPPRGIRSPRPGTHHDEE